MLGCEEAVLKDSLGNRDALTPQSAQDLSSSSPLVDPFLTDAKIDQNEQKINQQSNDQNFDSSTYLDLGMIETLDQRMDEAGIDLQVENSISTDEHCDENVAIPIVLIHGFAGFIDLGSIEYFFNVADDLRTEFRREVYVPALPAFQGSVFRAEQLKQAIDDIFQQSDACQIHLIAHSQGGLDSRIVLNDRSYAQKIASLTTIATPHQGTPLADIAEVLPNGTLNIAGRILAWIVGLTESADENLGDLNDKSALVDSLNSLGTSQMNDFNQSYSNPYQVPIYSISGVSSLMNPRNLSYCEQSLWGVNRCRDPIDPLLVASASILSLSGDGSLLSPRANDGLVPSDGAVFGTLLTCICADHFDQIGQITDILPEISGFDHLVLYRDIVRELQRHE